MKKNTIPLLVSIAIFSVNGTLKAEPLLTLFLTPYPEIAQQASKLAPKLHKPGKIATTQAKNSLTTLSGIFASYAGFLTVSDINGEISFPRKHHRPFVYVLITTQITPILMAGNTIHHWQIQQTAAAKLYKIEEQLDAQYHQSYWQVTQELLPSDARVPLETLILFVDPKYVDVPVGRFIRQQSPHLILPPVYIKKGFNLTLEALYIINLSNYFGAILPLFKKEKARYQRQLTY